MVLASVVLLFTVVFSGCAILTTYVIAVAAHHVQPFLPYISYTGNYPIESCIFSAALNIVASLLMLIIILRYSQIQYDISRNESFTEEQNKRNKRHNLASFVFGLMGALGMSVTGCFQQRIFHAVHMSGVAFLTIGMQAFHIYQTLFSFTFMAHLTNSNLRKARLALTIFTCLCYISIPSVYLINLILHNRKPFSDNWIIVPKIRESFATTIMAGLEWLMFFFNLVLFSTYYPDLKRITLQSDKITFLE